LPLNNGKLRGVHGKKCQHQCVRKTYTLI